MTVAKISGVRELANAMKLIDADLQQKVGRKMVASGAGIFRKQARANVTEKRLIKSKALYNNIVIKREPKAPPFTIQYNVGVRHGKNLTRKQKQSSSLVRRRGRISKRYDNDPYYWLFLEKGRNVYLGSKPGDKLTRKAKRKLPTRRVAATPFLEPVVQQKQNEAIDQMRQVANKELLKARS